MRNNTRFIEAIISDIDSTLADTRHRHHLSPTHNENTTWDDYALACADDAPMWGSIRVLQEFFKCGHSVHLISRRGETSRALTESWLRKYEVPFSTLRLHGPHDSEDSASYKIQHIRYLQERGMRPILILEDWPEITARITEETGIPVLTVNPLYSDLRTESFAKI